MILDRRILGGKALAGSQPITHRVAPSLHGEGPRRLRPAAAPLGGWRQNVSFVLAMRARGSMIPSKISVSGNRGIIFLTEDSKGLKDFLSPFRSIGNPDFPAFKTKQFLSDFIRFFRYD